MDINQLTEIIKIKLLKNKIIKDVEVQDKSHFHKDHATNEDKKFHIILKIVSSDLKNKNKIFANRYIFKILEDEMKNYIHSLRILFF